MRGGLIKGDLPLVKAAEENGNEKVDW